MRQARATQVVDNSQLLSGRWVVPVPLLFSRKVSDCHSYPTVRKDSINNESSAGRQASNNKSKPYMNVRIALVESMQVPCIPCAEQCAKHG
jgi:hypothetical protein